MRWWTSDLHLGHANIIGYCDRPFGDVEEMDAAIIRQWNDVVGADDDVWVLGDFALGGLSSTLPLAGRLAGHLTLVPGNHDRCWDGQRRGVERWTGAYLEAGFDRIAQAPLTARLEDRTVAVSHFPYRGDSQDEDRFVGHRPVDGGGWLLHGHVHDQWRQAGRMINVGIDAWGGRPVSERDLITMMRAGPADLPPMKWAR